MAALMSAVRGLVRGLAHPPTHTHSHLQTLLPAQQHTHTHVLQQRRGVFAVPPSYVFGKVHKPVKPKNRVVRCIMRRHDKSAPVADMEPYNRETKKYEMRRLMKMDPDDRMREALAAVKAKKLAERTRREELAMTAPPRQQIGEIRNFTHPPRKVNNYARVVRKMSARTALEQLTFMQHAKASRVVHMCIKQAVKNARINQGIDIDNLWVSHSYVGPGAKDKKELDIKGRGRYGTIKHRKTHYFLVLEEGKPPKKQSKFLPKNILTRWVHDRPAPYIQVAT